MERRPPNPEGFGAFIRTARLDPDMGVPIEDKAVRSQEDLAVQAGLSLMEINKIETGKKDPDNLRPKTLRALSETLGFTVGPIISPETEKPEPTVALLIDELVKNIQEQDGSKMLEAVDKAAAIAGVTKGTIYFWKQGRFVPNPDAAQKLLEFSTGEQTVVGKEWTDQWQIALKNTPRNQKDRHNAEPTTLEHSNSLNANDIRQQIPLAEREYIRASQCLQLLRMQLHTLEQLDATQNESIENQQLEELLQTQTELLQRIKNGEDVDDAFTTLIKQDESFAKKAMGLESTHR